MVKELSDLFQEFKEANHVDSIVITDESVANYINQM